MTGDCDKLDAYLAGELELSEAARFDAHLEVCEACREVVDQQRWMDGLLRSPVREEVEAPSATLGESIGNALARRRRRRRVVTSGLAAAVLLVAVGGLWHVNQQESHDSTAAAVAVSKPPEFIGSDDVLVVPVKSRYPNVTLVRVYPVYQLTTLSDSSRDQWSDGEASGGSNSFNGG